MADEVVRRFTGCVVEFEERVFSEIIDFMELGLRDGDWFESHGFFEGDNEFDVSFAFLDSQYFGGWFCNLFFLKFSDGVLDVFSDFFEHVHFW